MTVCSPRPPWMIKHMSFFVEWKKILNKQQNIFMEKKKCALYCSRKYPLIYSSGQQKCGSSVYTPGHFSHLHADILASVVIKTRFLSMALLYRKWVARSGSSSDSVELYLEVSSVSLFTVILDSTWPLGTEELWQILQEACRNEQTIPILLAEETFYGSDHCAHSDEMTFFPSLSLLLK